MCLFEILKFIFEKRFFLFGEWLMFVDIGFFGFMFRYFVMDLVFVVIMWEMVFVVMEWVYWFWNVWVFKFGGGLVDGVFEDIFLFFEEIGEIYLENLCVNVVVWVYKLLIFGFFI